LAICECGGRIYKEATGLDCCSRCARKFTDLACSFCHGRRFIAGATGNEWRAEEFGKALPGVVIKVVTGESEERTIDQSSQLIIATVGSAPIAQYQAIILAQGELVFGEISLRAEEQARYAWLRELRQAAPGAEIYIDLAPSHPFSQSIMRGDFRQWQENELTLRRQTGQPPYSRIFVIDSLPAHLASALVARLRQQCSSEIIDSYLPESARLLLQVPIVDASAALAIIKSALNLAYTLNQAAASLRVDPFRPF
jgi:primosomal protein N' (replication factor Y)